MKGQEGERRTDLLLGKGRISQRFKGGSRKKGRGEGVVRGDWQGPRCRWRNLPKKGESLQLGKAGVWTKDHSEGPCSRVQRLHRPPASTQPYTQSPLKLFLPVGTMTLDSIQQFSSDFLLWSLSECLLWKTHFLGSIHCPLSSAPGAQ